MAGPAPKGSRSAQSSVNVRKRVDTVVRAGTVGATREVVALALAIAEETGKRGKFAKAMRTIAKTMQGSVEEAFLGSVNQERAIFARDNRNSGGLLRAIRSKDFVTGDEDGIDFVNRRVMAGSARHWKRLNFGAGEIGDTGGPSPTYKLKYDQRFVADLRFRIPVQPAFMIPKGFFQHGGKKLSPRGEFRGTATGRAFYPRSKVMLSTTVGIRGRHFMEVGLETFAAEFPVAMDRLVRDAVAEKTRAGKAIQQVRVSSSTNPITGRKFQPFKRT